MDERAVALASQHQDRSRGASPSNSGRFGLLLISRRWAMMNRTAATTPQNDQKRQCHRVGAGTPGHNQHQQYCARQGENR